MKSKIYKIEYKNSYTDPMYSTTLQAARDYLTSKGFSQSKELNVEENDAEIWNSPETEMFYSCEAKISEITCIN